MSAEDLKKELEDLQAKFEIERMRSGEAYNQADRLQKEIDRAVEREKRQTEAPLHVRSSRKLSRFRGQPEDSDGLTVDEWIEDVRSQLAVRHLKGEEQTAFIFCSSETEIT